MATLIKKKVTKGSWSNGTAVQTVFHYAKGLDGERVVVMVWDNDKSVAEVRAIKGNFFRGKKKAVEFEASKVSSDLNAIAAEVHRLASKHF